MHNEHSEIGPSSREDRNDWARTAMTEGAVIMRINAKKKMRQGRYQELKNLLESLLVTTTRVSVFSRRLPK